MSRLELLAVIPARGGSKGVLRKNIRPLAGHPLIAWTIDAALKSGVRGRVVVSTDDPEIAAVARDYGAEVPFLRPGELARDDTTTLSVLQHLVRRLEEDEGYRPDCVVTLQPTSPLRRPSSISDAVRVFASDPEADSLVSCIEVPHIFHPRSVMRLNQAGYLEPYLEGRQPYRRQDKERVFARNGAAIYITRTARLAQDVFGGKLICFPMNEEESLDIDTMNDFAAAEARLAARSDANVPRPILRSRAQ